MSEILRCENPRCQFYCKDSYALMKHRAWCQSQEREPPKKRRRQASVEDILPHTTVHSTSADAELDESDAARTMTEKNVAERRIEESHDPGNNDDPDLMGTPSEDRGGRENRVDPETTGGTASEKASEKALDMMAVVVARLSKQVGESIMGDLFSALSNTDFCLPDFVKRYNTAYKCRKRMHDIVNRNMEQFGYDKIEFTDDASKLSGHVYLRDASEVLRKQVSKADDCEFHFFPTEKMVNGEQVYSNIMHTEFAKEVYERLRDERMASEDRSIFWRNQNSSSAPHFPAFLQLYSDKTATTMKSSALVAYPLHLTFLNFDSKFRCKLIKDNDSVIGYLSEEYVLENKAKYRDGGGTNDSNSRLRKACILNAAMREALKPIIDSLVYGLEVKTANGKKGLAISVIVNYTADIPEGKQMSGVLHGSNTKAPCIRCWVPGPELNSVKKYEPRSVDEVRKIRYRYRAKMNEVEELKRRNQGKKAALAKQDALEGLKRHSLCVIPSFFEDTSLIPRSLKGVNDVYNIFSYEPLHNLHLGISKEIKKMIFERLGSETIRCNGKPLKSLRKKY